MFLLEVLPDLAIALECCIAEELEVPASSRTVAEEAAGDDMTEQGGSGLKWWSLEKKGLDFQKEAEVPGAQCRSRRAERGVRANCPAGFKLVR